jgi:hypothetical protein
MSIKLPAFGSVTIGICEFISMTRFYKAMLERGMLLRRVFVGMALSKFDGRGNLVHSKHDKVKNNAIRKKV